MCIGDCSNSDVAVGAISLPNGCFLIGGTTDSNDGDISGLTGTVNVLLLKIDNIGNLLFQKCYGQFFESAESITPTTDGGVVTSGITTSNSCGFGGMDDFWIV